MKKKPRNIFLALIFFSSCTNQNDNNRNYIKLESNTFDSFNAKNKNDIEKGYISEDLGFVSQKIFSNFEDNGSFYFQLAKKEKNELLYQENFVWGNFEQTESDFIVTVRERFTKAKFDIILTAYRDNGCGFHRRMDDAIDCDKAVQKYSRLIIEYKPEKNAQLKDGIYDANIEINVLHTENLDFKKIYKIDISINSNTIISSLDKKNTLTELNNFESEKINLNDSPVFFNVENSINKNYNLFSTENNNTKKSQKISIKTFNKLMNENKVLVFTAFRLNNCNVKTSIYDSSFCPTNHQNFSQLKIIFDRSDNLFIKKGVYEGKFNILVIKKNNMQIIREIPINIKIKID